MYGKIDLGTARGERMLKFYNYCLVGLLLLVQSLAVFSEETIVMNGTESGYPPYIIKNENATETGIMIDVLRHIANKHDYKIVTKSIPKKRISQHIKLGTIDANATAKKWVVDPQNYAFTDVIIDMRDVLFSLKESSANYQVAKDLIGKKLSTHLGYRYPSLNDQIKNQQTARVDEYSELLMLKSVLSKRTDVAIANEVVGNWIINKHPKLQNKFEVSAKSFGSVGYRIMFQKKWQGFVNEFNKELAVMKQNGELESIVQKYQ